MNATDPALPDLLTMLQARGIAVEADAGALKVRGRRDALTPELRALLAARRDALLAYLDNQSGQMSPAPANDTDEFPLTDVQQAYWVGRAGLDLGGVGCHAYREFRAPATLDLTALERAWQAVVARHPMLRAVVTPEGTMRVLPQVPPYTIPLLDLRGHVDAQAQLEQLRERLSHQVFDASRWPLFDIRATRTDDGHVLHVGMDLLVADAASMLQLYREWGALYGQPSKPLALPGRQFAEFVRAQQADTGAQTRAAAYWEPRLDLLPGPPALPTLTRPADQPPRFVRHARSVDSATWSKLVALAREHELTPSNLLLAAYADVLAAFSSHQHFLLTLTAFHVPPQYAGVVGDYTTTLLLEVDARPVDFLSRARTLQRQLAHDLEHTAWSGVRVARELARRRGWTAQPVPVVFTSALGHTGAGERRLPLTWLGETIYAITQTPQVWIDHHVIEDGDTLHCSWDVLDGVLPAGMVEEMVEAHERLLQALAKGAAAWQCALSMHLPPQQAQRRARVNATEGPLPPGLLHDGFYALAARAPDRPALVTPARSLTYGELAGWAHAVAAEVRTAGIGPGELVAVEMHKGWQQVAAVLGIVAAGAAYLPIDAALPHARRAQLLARGRCRLALVAAQPHGTASDDGVRRIALESLTPRDTPPVGPAAAPSDLAYVIFTSGSTGEPKGVMVEHRAALNTVADLQRRYAIGAADAVLGLSSLSFDLSVFDIFGLLGAGGRLVLPEAGRERDPRHWAGLMAAHRVTIWNSVPALAQMLADSGEDPGPQLRLALLSGDWIPLALPDQLRACVPGLRVIGLGGATEASIWSNWFEVATVAPTWRSIPYGWPLANQRYHVLNDVLEPTPEGVPGRLFIAGAGLARGYWDDPVLTAQRFFAHPRSAERLYETGDLARYLPDGALEFLGRADTQVKLGGHRVELGEIEACLAQHPQVAQAVAYTIGPAGDCRLALAVVPRTRGAGPERSEVVAPVTGDLAALALQGQQPGVRSGNAGTRWVQLGELPTDTAPWRLRASVRDFSPQPVPLAALAGLLQALVGVYSAGEQGLVPKRRYPSGGSLYAVQCWVQVEPGRIDGLSGGLYYHHPLHHALEPVEANCAPLVAAQFVTNQGVGRTSAFALLLVAELEAVQDKYGPEAGRDMALLEAGSICQLLMEQAPTHGLGLCPIGGMDTAQLPAALALGPQRPLLHGLLGGIPQAADTDLPAALRDWLAQRLPAYMVTDRIDVLQRLPLTANGKVDRSRLLQAQAGAAPPTAAVPQIQVPPEALETLLRKEFAAVLGQATVPLETGIFELGGTSLHVVRLHRALEQVLGRRLDILALFRHPSVAALARWLQKQV